VEKEGDYAMAIVDLLEKLDDEGGDPLLAFQGAFVKVIAKTEPSMRTYLFRVLTRIYEEVGDTRFEDTDDFIDFCGEKSE
jgi:hypothetical protein